MTGRNILAILRGVTPDEVTDSAASLITRGHGIVTTTGQHQNKCECIRSLLMRSRLR